MKAGYATLFSLAVAYSAYQGAGSSKPGSGQQEPSRSLNSANATESARPRNLPAGAEPFPTIAGGICPLTVTGNSNGPCGNCQAICAATDLSELLKNHFRAESGSDKEYLAKHWNVPRAEQGNIKFVIASLPDPVHTHMALLLDRGIEAIQRAAQASGYLFSRAWMPWDIATHSESADFTVRLAQEEFRNQVESLPGLMIFRGSGGDKHPMSNVLLVFVVGETPTGGLHVEQFENALNIRQSILADAKPDLEEAKILRINGPAFSGSLPSLDKILNAQPRKQFSTILIRSGTISSYRAMHDFCESTSKEWPEDKPDHGGRPDFATFQFSDAYQEFYLKVFFGSRNNSHSRVAILSEDETAFGNQEDRQSMETSDPCQVKPRSPEDFSPPLDQFSFVRLYFPREIAQLRDAYQRNVKDQSAAVGKKNPQSGLPLSLSVTGNDDDSVAAYASLQTPLSQESILQSIVATLRHEHVKVVVIRGTDPLDVVFLCRYLRQNYPQARLVTTGADLLMINDYYDPRSHGILAVSTYPLLAGANFPALRTGGERDIHRLFPDSFSVGVFNAFLSLLPPLPKTQSGNLATADYAQFGLPSFLQPTEVTGESAPWSPHLWLAAVGREGYWPVAVLDDVPASVLQAAGKPQRTIRAVEDGQPELHPYSVHFTIGWTILWMATLGLSAFTAFLLAFPPTSTRSEILGRFGAQSSPTRNCLLFAGCLLLLACQTVFLFPAIVWLGRFGLLNEGLSEITHGLGRVMACYLISAGWLGFACYQGFSKRGSPKLASTGVFLCGAAIFLTLLFTSLLWSGKLGTDLGAFAYRYLNVGSGVSPALPLVFLLAAWIWWCWQSLTGITATEEKHLVLPDASNFDAPLVPEAYDRVRLRALGKVDEWPWKSLGAFPLSASVTVPAFAGFIAVLLLIHPWEIAEAFESQAYKITYWILLYSCLLLVCYLLTQIVALWLEFRELLQAIERLPFRRGFGNLKTLTWKPLWKLAGSGRQEFRKLLREEVDVLRQVQNGETAGGLKKAIDDAREATDKVSDEYDRKGAKVQQLFGELQTEVAKLASKALIYASEQWKKELYAPPATKPDTSDGDTAATEPPAKEPTLRAVEHFLCLFYLNVILVPLRRLQTLILGMAGVFVFVLISYSSYPFESRESFHALLISIFFVISLVVGIVYGQMFANPLLARITNTKPGELGLDFWVRLGTFVFVPLLSLLSVQFPEINNFLFSWLQPALQSIK